MRAGVTSARVSREHWDNAMITMVAVARTAVARRRRSTAGVVPYMARTSTPGRLAKVGVPA